MYFSDEQIKEALESNVDLNEASDSLTKSGCFNIIWNEVDGYVLMHRNNAKICFMDENKYCTPSPSGLTSFGWSGKKFSDIINAIKIIYYWSQKNEK